MSSPSLTYLQSCKLRSTNSIVIISSSCCSALVAMMLLLLPIVVDQISSPFFLLLLFFFFLFSWHDLQNETLQIASITMYWQQMNYFWIQKQKKNKKELEIWQKNTRSPEEGKQRGNAQESTDRWTQQEYQRIKPGGEYGPLDATRTPEDKTQRRVRTDRQDNNTRRQNPEQYTDRRVKL